MSGFLVILCRFMCFQLFSRLETHGCTISSMRRLSKSSHENHSNQTSYSRTIMDHHTDDIKHLTTVKDLILMFSFVGQHLKTFRTSTEKILDSSRFWRGRTRNCFSPSSSAHWRSGTRRTECVWGRWDEDRDVKSPNYCELISCDCLSQHIQCDTICPYVWPNAKGSVAVCFSILTFKQRNKYRTSWVWAAVW